jgi:hypothetical protein
MLSKNLEMDKNAFEINYAHRYPISVTSCASIPTPQTLKKKSQSSRVVFALVQVLRRMSD